MRNKAKGFPNQVNHKFEGEPGATDAYASKRPNGETNTRPQERMRGIRETLIFPKGVLEI